MMHWARTFRCSSWSPGLVVLLIACGNVESAHGQPPEGKSAEAKPQLEAFTLRYADATTTATVVSELFPKNDQVRVIADPRSNRLIVWASGADLLTIRKFLEQVDGPRGNNERGPQTDVFYVRKIALDENLEKILKVVLGETKGTSFALDPKRNAVIIRGDRNTMDMVKAILSNLEQQVASETAVNIQVRIVWLVDGEAPEKGKPLSRDLKSIEAPLAKLGMDRVWVVGQLLVNAQPDKEFQGQGRVDLGLKSPVMWEVAGKFSVDKRTARLELTIDAKEMTPGLGGPGALCHLSTEITAPPGHVVLLGTTPTEGRTSVFVVQLLAQEKKDVQPVPSPHP
jgi:hypothetical protein